MSTSTSLPLSDVCAVTVSVSPVAPASPTFNQGLIVGPSTIIPTATRVRQYTSLSQMTTDGFSSSNPEYVAAQVYFSQSPAPTVLWVGRQDATVPETALQAVTASRLATSAWWGCMVTDAAASDHAAIAAYIEAAAPASSYFYATADAAVLNNTAGNVLSVLQTAAYKRSFGIYGTTQSGSAPNNAYLAAAALGLAMGLNTGIANSNFTMKFKQLVGMAPEPAITQSQVTAIETLAGNLYVNVGGGYQWLEQGVAASGQFLDVTLGLDMLVSDIQLSCVNQLISNPAIPHNNAGEAILVGAVSSACDRAVSRGFLSPGTWNGQTILGLTAGNPLPKGYLIQTQSFTLQSGSDRQARKAMPIYCSVVLAGAMHSLTIGLSVSY